MDIRGRRALYISAIIIFLIVAPILLLYSQGYRFDVKTRSMIHIGAISVDSIPHGAVIAIDRTTTRRSTPALISGTYPGSYRIALSKPGFQPWSIDAVVSANNTAILNATLLPATAAIHYAVDSPIVAAATSAINRKIALAYGTTDHLNVGLLDIGNGSLTPIAHYAMPSIDSLRLTWSPHGKYLAVMQPTTALHIIDPITQQEAFAGSIQHATDIVWNPSNDNIAYVVGDGSLWEIDLLKKTSRVVASPHIVAAAFDVSALWMLRSDGTDTTVERLSVSSSNQVQQSRTIPVPQATQLFLQSGHCVVLTSQSAYLFDLPDGKMITLPVSEIDTVHAGSNRDEILLSSASEVWTLDVPTSEISLLVRQSNIQSARWFPNRNAVLVLSKDVVHLHDITLRAANAGQLGPFDHALSIVIVDDKTVAILSATAVDVLLY